MGTTSNRLAIHKRDTEETLTTSQDRVREVSGMTPAALAADTASPSITDQHDVDFVGEEKSRQRYDPLDPHTWPKSTRWLHTVYFGLLAGFAFFPAGAWGPGEPQIERDFHINILLANVGISMFPAGFTVGPLLMAGLSELVGRTIVFKVALPLAIVSSLLVGFSQNIAMALVFRFFQGLLISGPFAVAGGAVSDLWPKADRRIPVIVFAVFPNMAANFGPFIGSVVNQFTTWRWVFWLISIVYAVLYGVMWLSIHETYTPHLRREIVLTRDTIKAKLWTALIRPLVLLFTEPIVLALSIYIAFVYGIIFGFFASFAVVYQRNRHWTTLQGGFAYLGLTAGVAVSAVICAFIRPKSTKPEAQLYPALIGAILLPASIFTFGATSSPSIPGIVSIVAAGGIGASLMFLFLSITSYLVEAYTLYAASALAANGLARTAVAAVFPLFSRQMYLNLGSDWASYLLGFISVAMMPIPFVLVRWGHLLREKGNFAKAPQL